MRNRVALQAAGAPLSGTEVVYIDTEWFAGPLYRLASRLFPRSQHSVYLVSSLDFFAYDYAALRVLRRRGPKPWRLIHAVTPVSPMAATRLHRLGKPLIVGPWNGGMETPKTFGRIMREDSAWLYRVRDLRPLVHRITGCAKSAQVVLSATRATDASMPEACRPRVLRMSENGVDLDVFRPASEYVKPGPETPLQVLFVGRLIPAKGTSLLLAAVARVAKRIQVHLTVIGDGPLRGELVREANELGIAGVVDFKGDRPLAEVAVQMQQAHVFCLPSVRESGGAVLLEAMASSVPVIAVNHGGPAEVVDDSVGRLVSGASSETVIEELESALLDNVARSDEWRARGLAGRRRAEAEYGWDDKINRALVLYERLASSSAVEWANGVLCPKHP
jgi:glycosyltransferase involved in cell wall biosynthesis